MTGSWFISAAHTSPWPISSCISTPPSSAAHGTWLDCLAVLYSAWKLKGDPLHVLGSVFMNPCEALAMVNPV